MMTYWMMFLVAACGVLSPSKLPTRQSRWVWLIIGLVFTVIMGFRHEVGADWFNYLPNFDMDARLSPAEIFTRGDPAYHALDWLVAQFGGDIYFVNLVCASIMMWGTVQFCRQQPNQWLALLAAVPYMLIVVGMGYTRQAAALGFGLIGLCALGKGRIWSFIAWVAFGALFHKSAILLVPIAALAATRNRILVICLVLLVAYLMYYFLVEDSVDVLRANYVDFDRGSEGGMIRVLMNVLPAALFLLFQRWLEPDEQERKLWLWLAICAFVCVPLVTFASTAVDRVALYLIPIQLFVFSRLPRLAVTQGGRTSLVLATVAYYAAVQFVWLHYATHAQYWVPYQFMPLG